MSVKMARLPYDDPIDHDPALQVPRYEAGRLYPTDALGIGAVNENLLPERITAGKAAVTPGKA